MTTCPACGKAFSAGAVSSAPFCSDRCRLVDLGQWLEGAYRVPASEMPAPTRETDASGDEADAGGDRS
ncbi:MAG: DNA gyrase inhibitor YacG [Deltaproteobacteria bacterium]|nr:DNA gyrase inhibitor YacG [Deltaproteobacteria bacterium]